MTYNVEREPVSPANRQAGFAKQLPVKSDHRPQESGANPIGLALFISFLSGRKNKRQLKQIPPLS